MSEDDDNKVEHLGQHRVKRMFDNVQKQVAPIMEPSKSEP